MIAIKRSRITIKVKQNAFFLVHFLQIEQITVKVKQQAFFAEQFLQIEQLGSNIFEIFEWPLFCLDSLSRFFKEPSGVIGEIEFFLGLKSSFGP